MSHLYSERTKSRATSFWFEASSLLRFTSDLSLVRKAPKQLGKVTKKKHVGVSKSNQGEHMEYRLRMSFPAPKELTPLLQTTQSNNQPCSAEKM